MKLSKKILTFVAPIAAVMAVTPVITSCNKETFDFKYGDSINCYKAGQDGDFYKGVTLHSLGKVQEAAKNHTITWPFTTVTQAQLDEFKLDPQYVYYDLVASLAVNDNKGFALKWSYDTTAKTFELDVKSDNHDFGVKDKTLEADVAYEEAAVGGNGINLVINGTLKVKSYVFDKVTIEAK